MTDAQVGEKSSLHAVPILGHARQRNVRLRGEQEPPAWGLSSRLRVNAPRARIGGQSGAWRVCIGVIPRGYGVERDEDARLENVAARLDALVERLERLVGRLTDDPEPEEGAPAPTR